jgi:hypothetical protein
MRQSSYLKDELLRKGCMYMAVNHDVRKILDYKANALRANRKYLEYVDKLLKELNVTDVKDAFLMGAIDTMINGVASAMNHTGQWKASFMKEVHNRK